MSGIQKILSFLAGRANILIRVAVTEPLQAISSDITEIWYQGGTKRLYLATHKDVYGQYVYGWKLANTMTVDLVIESLTMAWSAIQKFTKGNPPTNLIIHQDRGSQYTSYEYVMQVVKIHGRISFSDPGTPTHNPGQESFHGRFKEEWAEEILEIQTEQEVRRFVEEKIDDYNGDRLHTSIGLLSPIRYMKRFLKISGY